MCGLFGLMSYGNKLKDSELNSICNTLAEYSEDRGSHATGISYFSKGKLIVNKAPMPAHKMKFRIPNDAITIMGHTRHATQGSEKKLQNNHPFFGRFNNKNAFTLAHNGILCNDTLLRKKLNLPKTKIETDSYIAVQLLEQSGNLKTEALKNMAEQVSGSFTFTLMDNCNNLYIIKGDSPISLIQFEELGLYVYASTDEILYKSLVDTMLLKHLKAGVNGEKIVKPIDIRDGNIVKINVKGDISVDTFEYDDLGSFGLRWWDSTFKRTAQNDDIEEYLEMLRLHATEIGANSEDVDKLYEYGFSLTEIEEMLYEPGMVEARICE